MRELEAAEKDGIVYSSLYDDDVRVSVEGGLVTASGKLRDENAERCLAENRAIVLLTRFQEELRIRAEFERNADLSTVSGADEAVSVEENGKPVIICKKNGQVLMESNSRCFCTVQSVSLILYPAAGAWYRSIRRQAGLR